jgi:hypothetical protein
MGNVFELLDDEWRRLRRDRAAARRLQTVCDVAGGSRVLADVEAYVRAATPPDADRVLLALVARAIERDGLAARVLLQLLLPGTRALARRWWALGDADERAAAAVTAVYHRICHYPLARRPGRVAANILMNAAHELRRAVPRVISVPAADPAALAPRRRQTAAVAPADLHPAAELGELLHDAVAAGIVERSDAELIARSRIAGDRMADIAHHRGLRPRTVWDRRQRAEGALVAAGTSGWRTCGDPVPGRHRSGAEPLPA